MVKKSGFNIPTITPEHSDYIDGGTHVTVTDTGYNATIMKRAGYMSAIKAGEYIVVYSLIDKESAYWNSDTPNDTDDKEIKWYIDKITVDVPMPNKTVYETDFTYSMIRKYDNIDHDTRTTI